MSTTYVQRVEETLRVLQDAFEEDLASWQWWKTPTLIGDRKEGVISAALHQRGISVSRTTVRKYLRDLRHRGLITENGGWGYRTLPTEEQKVEFERKHEEHKTEKERKIQRVKRLCKRRGWDFDVNDYQKATVRLPLDVFEELAHMAGVM
jgi:biotin operon repressor